MRAFVVVTAVVVLLAGCSDPDAHLSPAEKAKRARGMSEDVWKVYGGTESGVTDNKDAKGSPPKEKQ